MTDLEAASDPAQTICHVVDLDVDAGGRFALHPVQTFIDGGDTYTTL